MSDLRSDKDKNDLRCDKKDRKTDWNEQTSFKTKKIEKRRL